MIPFPHDPEQETRLSIEHLTPVLEKMFVKKSMFQFDAAVAVKRMVEADLYGIPSHGVGRFAEYLDAMDVGDIDPRGRVLVMNDQPSFAVLDGSRAIGQVAATKGIETAIAKAEATGIGFVTVSNSQTLGAASVYTRLAAEQGLLAVCFSSTGGATVAAPGTQQGVTGNSAFSYAVPFGTMPIVFDSACGQESWGKLELLRRYGIPLPPGLLLDENGAETTDLQAARAMRPAGELGFGLSLLTSILAGPLCGGWLPVNKVRSASAEDSQHVFLAINISTFADPERFQKELTRGIEKMQAVEGFHLPGTRAPQPILQVQETGKSTLSLHRSYVDELRARAEKMKIELPPELFC